MIDKEDDDSCPVETPARRGFSVSYRGKTLLSRIDPITQGERAAAEAPVSDHTLYVCPSPLYAYGLPLLRKRLPETSAILCIEVDDQLFALSKRSNEAQESDLEAMDNFIHTSKPDKLCAFVRQRWGKRSFRRIEVVHLSTGWQLFPLVYESLILALRQELAVEWGNAMTLIRLGRLYSRNLIRNLALLPHSERSSALSFGAASAIVLGAGPSLDATLDALSPYARETNPQRLKFKIICVDTALTALHERGIRPDLVVILESQHWNLRDFSGLRGKNIDAAIDLSALAASARVLGGRRFFFATPWTELALFRRLQAAGLLGDTFLPLGSVGLCAVAIALRATSAPVLVSGIDFSYSLDSYHARSTPSNLDMHNRQSRTRSLINVSAAFREGTFSVKGKNGEMVRSDPGMRSYAKLFEQVFGGEKRLFDIEGSGISLSIQTIPLDKALAILNKNANGKNGAPSKTAHPAHTVQSDTITAFARQELDALDTLKKALSGESPLSSSRLTELIHYADYLYAHFPEYAGKQGGKGSQPELTDTSFLKRLRTEIEPFQKCWEMTLRELEKAQE